MYDFRPSSEGNVQPLDAEEEDIEILETSTSNEPVTEVATTVTSALQGNDHKFLFSAFLSHIVSEFSYFAETFATAI